MHHMHQFVNRTIRFSAADFFFRSATALRGLNDDIDQPYLPGVVVSGFSSDCTERDGLLNWAEVAWGGS
jgi:hypothetical protein